MVNFGRVKCTGLVFCIALMAATVSGQIYVQLERAGTLKTVRYSTGDILTFRLLHDDKGWYERVIVGIDVDRRRIIFPDVPVHVDSIEAVRIERGAAGAKIMGTALQAGGANLILFSAYDAIFRDTSFDWTAALFGAGNFGVGTLIRQGFKYRTFRVGPRKRIRLLDLNFSGSSSFSN